MKSRVTILCTILLTLCIFTGLNRYYAQQDDPTLDLNTIMRLLLVDVHTINEGIYTHNFDLIELGAASINEHPSLSDHTLERVRETLGDEMLAFSRFDNIVHSYADSIKYAARNRDMQEVLNNYRIMEQSCINCHTAFQDTLRFMRINE